MNKKQKQIMWVSIGIGLTTAIVLAIVYRKKLKKMAKETFEGQSWFDTSLKWYRDNHTKNIVNGLHPQFRNKIGEFFAKAEKDLGLQMYATSGLRTFEKQAELHKQNASNAKAGYSDHNYGFAVDAVVFKNGKQILKKADSKADWEKSGVVKIAKDLGLSWGGDYKSYHDPVHFYIRPKGLTSTQLLAKVNAGQVDKEGYVIV